MPYAYPTPAAGVPGSQEGTTKADKPVVAQSTAAANIPNLSGSAALPPRVSLFQDCCFRSPRAVLAWHAIVRPTFVFQGGQGPQAPRPSLHSKASSNSLNGLSESGQYAKQLPARTPPASPIQTPAAEPPKEKTLHASDTEGIKAEGQAAAMAAIAAAQARVNGPHIDGANRANSSEHWVRSNSEEDLERADSGGLQVRQ